jgi:hypothetical protein
MRIASLLVAVCMATLSACTTYSQGVESFWQKPDVLIVSGAGNGFTTQNQIDEYVLLRAAEKAVESRYRYFVMLDSKNTGSTTASTYSTPRVTTFNASSYGNSTYGSMTTTGGTQTMYVYNPGRDAAFRMFDGIPSGYRPGQYHDAVDVLNTLGPKFIDGFQPVSAADVVYDAAAASQHSTMAPDRPSEPTITVTRTTKRAN